MTMMTCSVMTMTKAMTKKPRLLPKRADAAKAKKQKAKPVGRTQVVFEVKPWEADTDLEKLAQEIKGLDIEGLKWGEAHKIVPVAFGIKKLLIQCIVIDD